MGTRMTGRRGKRRHKNPYAKQVPFTEDQFHRVMNNLLIVTHRFQFRSKTTIDEQDRRDLYRVVEDITSMAYQLFHVYGKQFHHQVWARRTCPNPDCHSIYAIFWEDWEYCPKCGTPLRKDYANKEEYDRHWEQMLADLDDED